MVYEILGFQKCLSSVNTYPQSTKKSKNSIKKEKSYAQKRKKWLLSFPFS